MSKVVLKSDHFLVECNRKITKFSYARILTIYFANGLSVFEPTKGAKKVLPMNFSTISQALAERGFLQNGRCQIINKEHIATIDRYGREVTMTDGSRFPISRRRVNEVAEAWINS